MVPLMVSVEIFSILFDGGWLVYLFTLYTVRKEGEEPAVERAQPPEDQLFLACVWYDFFIKGWLCVLHFYASCSCCQNLGALNARARSGSQQGRPDREEDSFVHVASLSRKLEQLFKWMNGAPTQGSLVAEFPKELNVSVSLIRHFHQQISVESVPCVKHSIKCSRK